MYVTYMYVLFSVQDKQVNLLSVLHYDYNELHVHVYATINLSKVSKTFVYSVSINSFANRNLNGTTKRVLY